MKPRLVVLVSGNGTNLQAILNACANGTLAAEVVGVVSSRPGVPALARAERAGVPSRLLSPASFRQKGATRLEFDLALAEVVAAFHPSVVVLAGWMHILSAAFLEQLDGPVLNLHPALPGAFPGMRAIARAYHAARDGIISHTGVMVHHVTPEVDAGPVVAVTEVPILPGDSLAMLRDRMHKAEHPLLVEALQRVLAALESPR